MDGDKAFNAVFETIPVYTVKTFVKNDAELSLGSVTLSPDDNNGRYEEGTEITVTAENSKIQFPEMGGQQHRKPSCDNCQQRHEHHCRVRSAGFHRCL